MTPTHSIAAIKASVSLREMIGEHVELRKAGKDLIGLCPFHDEKTPSFHVHENFYKCFGCSASGDVIDFLAHVESISKGAAIRQLAERYGVSMDGPALNRAQRTLAREDEEFAVWWKAHVVGRMERQLTAYVVRLDIDTTEEQCETIGALLRQLRAVKRVEIAEVARRCATAAERAEWRVERWDVQVWTRVCVGMLGDAAQG